VPDLGLDKVEIYRFDAGKGTLAPTTHPLPRWRLAPARATSRFIRKAASPIHQRNRLHSDRFPLRSKAGRLHEVQTLSTLPEGEPVKPSYSTAELFAHPSGKFLYGSNRGHNSIVLLHRRPDRQTEARRTRPTQGKTRAVLGSIRRPLAAGGQSGFR